jgi:hypothetical protein
MNNIIIILENVKLSNELMKSNGRIIIASLIVIISIIGYYVDMILVAPFCFINFMISSC